MGTTKWLMSVRARTPLVGGLTSDAQWFALAVGVIGALLVAAVVEVSARRRNAAIATLALNRVFADEDYDALRLRFTSAMALLEGPLPQMAAGARALLRAGVRAEMEQLLTALGRYHPNVVRLRLVARQLAFR